MLVEPCLDGHNEFSLEQRLENSSRTSLLVGEGSLSLSDVSKTKYIQKKLAQKLKIVYTHIAKSEKEEVWHLKGKIFG